MDIDRLRYFCAVTNTGSLSRASELLGISQPALSKAIKTLEREIGQTLIVPSGRGIAVTDIGKRLSAEALPLLDKFFALPDTIQSKALGHELKIASFEVFTTYFLGAIIEEVFSDYHVESFELTPGALEDKISKNLVDMGVTYLPIPHPDLDHLKVSSIKMGVFGQAKKFSSLPFSNLPFVVPNIPIEGSPTKNKGLDGWPDDLHPRKIIHRVGMLEAGLDLCRRGLTVGYFPHFIVEFQNQVAKNAFHLSEIKIPSQYKVKKSFDVYAIKRKSEREDKTFKKLTMALRNLVH